MKRLSPETLASLPANVGRPAYDRAAVTTGVVHLGIGAFHRAHQADVFDRALAAGDLRWGIRGVSLRSAGVRDQLNPQHGLYAMVVREGDAASTRIIGAVRDVLVAPESPSDVVDALAHPDTHIATLTVTEKGYRLDPASGALIEDDPEVASDLASLALPRTAPGFITAALERRRARGLDPLTIISCDNLPHNGTRTRDAVLAMARRHDPALADWIGSACAFPQTMIDRIVPATMPEDRAVLARRLGVEDHGMVKTEPFTQWVIEDWFAGPRPDFASLGVQVTTAVAPWEDAKLRLLNGAHSAMAYLGGLAGLRFVHEVMAEPVFAALVDRLWDEAAETLTPPLELDLSAYRQDLRARFTNAALEHRTHQIAMDGSQKLPQRLLATCISRLDRGAAIPALSLAIAAWMHWQEGRDERGAAFCVDDPLAPATAQIVATTPDPMERVAAFVALRQVFPARLGQDPVFVGAVAAAYLDLIRHGARHAAARAMQAAR